MRTARFLSTLASLPQHRALSSMPPPPIPRFLIVDFDGTCTVQETTALLPHLAATLGPAHLASSKLATFASLEQQYVAGLAALTPPRDAPAPARASLDQRALAAYLQRMDDHSTAVTRRVSDSRCLAHLDASAVPSLLARWAAAPHAAPLPPPRLREGCVRALSALGSRGCSLGVLSINWCAPLIRAVLAELRLPFDLWCNELCADGTILLPVAGAAQKREVIAALVARAAGEGAVVYVGDSATDLLAMLEADVGILIGESSSARRVARNFGVAIVPLPASLDECAVATRGTVFEASSWDDVHRCLVGVELSSKY
ncbi:hypothetical protein AB1Y20_002157 [Prymnesium parvum]|uniref:Haloacid dehalogenase-like hydrolase n=1 Tax=Prymnesium parvum TaxID=97485 RepID=A0AB34JAV7_PRYPA